MKKYDLNSSNFEGYKRIDMFQRTQKTDEKSVDRNQSVNVRMMEPSRIRPNPRNPYPIDLDDYDDLKRSITQIGIRTAILARKTGADEYEVISGHRRLKIANELNLSEVPVMVIECTDDEAMEMLVDSNIYRDHMPISVKAKAYGMKYNALKSQGKPGDTLEYMCSNSKSSRASMERYIALSRLPDTILRKIDKKSLGLVAAVDLSYLKDPEIEIIERILESGIKVSRDAAARLHQTSKNSANNMVEKEILEIVNGAANKTQKQRVRKLQFNWKEIQSITNDKYTPEQISKLIKEYLRTL